MIKQIKKFLKKEIADHSKITACREHGVYFLFDDIDDSSMSKAGQYLIEADRSGKFDHIDLFVNSRGGGIDAVFSLIDTMNGISTPVHTIGTGSVISAGLLLTMSGEPGHRVITPNTTVMSHQFSGCAWGKEHDLESYSLHLEHIKARLVDHFRKCTGLSEGRIVRELMPASDVWMTANDALQYNLCDRVEPYGNTK